MCGLEIRNCSFSDDIRDILIDLFLILYLLYHFLTPLEKKKENFRILENLHHSFNIN